MASKTLPAAPRRVPDNSPARSAPGKTVNRDASWTGRLNPATRAEEKPDIKILLLANQLNPVPKRIVHMAAPNSRNIVRLVYRNPRIPQSLHQPRIVTAPQRRMRLLCRSEIIFHSKMDLHITALKPASAAFRKLRRLGQLLHPQQPP